MNRVITYFKNVHNELVNKTTWPSWTELFASARIVMIASVIIAAVIFVMDFAFEHLLEAVYSVL